MKKKFFIPLCDLAAIFAACSNDDNPIADESAQVIDLFVSNTSDNQLATRAGRPLYGSEALQDVDSVVVYIYDQSGSIKHVTTIEDWKSVSSAHDNGRKYTFRLTGEQKLPIGKYTLRAYAHSENTSAVFKQTPQVNFPYEGVEVAFNNNPAEEFFAGNSPLKVEGTPAEFTAGNTVVLKRQVAGAFGYFTNIPAKVLDKETKTIRLVSSVKNTTVEISDLTENQTNGKTPADPADAKLKNGSDAFVVYEANVQDWFTSGDSSNDGLLGVDDIWTTQIPNNGVKILDNTILIGNFLVPVAKHDTNNTFELQLLAADGTITKTWNVGIQDNKIVSGDTKHRYGIYRNHLYGIGQKTLNNPEDPTNPGVGHTEEPIDLSKDQDIIIDINSTWDVIHSLELE